MTASNTNSAGCENSVFQISEDGITTANAHLIVPLVEYIDGKTGPACRLEFSKEFRLWFFDLDQILRWLEQEGYLVLRGPCPHEDIVVTSKAELIIEGNNDG